MIHKHYKQLVNPAEGSKWFGIRRDYPGTATRGTTLNSPTDEHAPLDA